MSKRGAHLRNLGLYRDGNWPEYRHGPKGPPLKQRPIFKTDKRRHVVGQAMAVLNDFVETPFEREATVRHGLRRALCMDGFPWARSDAEAASIVEEALRGLGAVRPSLAEGQWEYTISPDYCASCHGPLDDETQSKGRRFCSAVCAKAVYEARAYGITRRSYAIAQNAYVIIRTAEAPFVDCQHCRKPFQRMNIAGAQARGGGKFCTKACADAAQRVFADRDCAECGKTYQPTRETQYLCSTACRRKSAIKGPNRVCEHCATSFRYYRAESKPEGGRFCSPRCFHAGKSESIEIHRDCDWCETPFIAKSSKARCCSSQCTQRIINLRAGKPKAITTSVFDYLLRKQGVRLTSPRITDALFAEAA